MSRRSLARVSDGTVQAGRRVAELTCLVCGPVGREVQGIGQPPRGAAQRQAGMHAVIVCLVRRRARYAALGRVAVPAIMSWSAEDIRPAL